MIADYFKDPEWSVSFKKDEDLSLNSPHCSEAAKALDDYYSGEVLGPHDSRPSGYRTRVALGYGMIPYA